MGVIFGLERLKTKSIVNVFTDSRYVINGIEKGWAIRWRRKNWYRTRTEKASNHDLWSRLLDLIEAHERVTFNWVKGHDGHVENERCDQLALAALKGSTLLVDVGYLPVERENEDMNTEVGGLSSFNKTKVNIEGDACRKCGVKVVKKPTRKKVAKPGQTYYYDYFLLCPACKTMYLTEDAKRPIAKEDNNLFT